MHIFRQSWANGVGDNLKQRIIGRRAVAPVQSQVDGGGLWPLEVDASSVHVRGVEVRPQGRILPRARHSSVNAINSPSPPTILQESRMRARTSGEIWLIGESLFFNNYEGPRKCPVRGHRPKICHKSATFHAVTLSVILTSALPRVTLSMLKIRFLSSDVTEIIILGLLRVKHHALRGVPIACN